TRPTPPVLSHHGPTSDDPQRSPGARPGRRPGLSGEAGAGVSPPGRRPVPFLGSLRAPTVSPPQRNSAAPPDELGRHAKRTRPPRQTNSAAMPNSGIGITMRAKDGSGVR